VLNINEVMSSAEDYIKNAASNASKSLKGAHIKFEIFKGTLMDFTPKMCADIYRDMLKGMLTDNCTIAQKYCLFAILVPFKSEEEMTLSLQLGIVWPNMRRLQSSE